jgi:outer membrane lipoprotein LolB
LKGSAAWRAALLLAVLVAGCTRPERPPEAPSADGARLLALDHWEARGRIAVRREGDRPDGGQASMDWAQAGPQTTVALRGPFGAGGYEIATGPAGLVVRSAAGEAVIDDPSPDAAERWFASQLGWSFPVASARYWLRGLADPAVAAEVVRDTDGRVASLRQQGWEVDFAEYLAASGLWLPRRMTLTGTPAGVPHRVRIVIDRWLLDIPHGANRQ